MKLSKRWQRYNAKGSNLVRKARIFKKQKRRRVWRRHSDEYGASVLAVMLLSKKQYRGLYQQGYKAAKNNRERRPPWSSLRSQEPWFEGYDAYDERPTHPSVIFR